MCVRLALVVVLDLSSPRGGLGTRIAWGLPWGDLFFSFFALVVFVCSVRCRGKGILVSLDYRLMDVVAHLLVQRYMFCLRSICRWSRKAGSASSPRMIPDCARDGLEELM